MASQNSTALIKSILHKSLAEGVYRDIVTRNSNYYYYLGKTISWENEVNPPYPTDSYAYERLARSEIITMKEIKATDVSFVIPRVTWVANTVYDMYDDQYDTRVTGLNIINGGSGYSNLPTITVTGGGGSGAVFTAVVDSGSGYLIGYDVTSHGSGYTSVPTVTVSGGRTDGGSDAVIEAVITKSPSGSQKLEECNFYVMTEDFNVYKCLDNNNNIPSITKPSGTQITPITSAGDGYVWKFMYSVPINLRSKFLSDEQIPVVTALTNQFYSGGAIDTLVINSKGADYTTASINVSGDGYLEADPTYLTSVSVSDAGSGYTDPVVTISAPFSDSTLFVSGFTVYLDQRIVTSTGHYYSVQTPGALGSIEPTHTYGTVLSGTAALTFIGSRAIATATTVDGEITAITMTGGLREVVMLDGGSGYTSAPSVNITGGGGSLAVASVKMYNDSIMYVTVTNHGTGYTSDPTITFGDIWQDGLSVLVGEQYYYSTRLYTVTQDGTFSSVAPSHATGEEVNGTAKLTYVGVPATGSSIRRFGAGYSTSPTLVITDEDGTGAEAAFLTTKSEAKLLPIIENGQLVSVIVQDGGVGYSTASVAVTGDGDGALIVADLNIGSIQSLQANNEILTPAGTINAIKVISGGYGYGVANIIIHGDGVGATATATLDSSSGKITKITITNPGTGYTFANVVVDGNGKGALLRAIMPPFGGHGKNAPDELFARTLMFYSNVSTDLNQGVAINNDYRQVGIIKNPRYYGSDSRFTGSIGSGCFIIECDITPEDFIRDTNLTIPRTHNGVEFLRRFRVVSVGATYALVQSLDNDIPFINDIFTKVSDDASPPSFTALSVGYPTVDKYSGQMMFIDNKAGFTPSEDETVTLRTVLQF
jgi:hypothetical protein